MKVILERVRLMHYVHYKVIIEIIAPFQTLAYEQYLHSLVKQDIAYVVIGGRLRGNEFWDVVALSYKVRLVSEEESEL